MLWIEQTNYGVVCYFCPMPLNAFPEKSDRGIEYANASSVTKLQLHSNDIPVPECPVQYSMETEAK